MQKKKIFEEDVKTLEKKHESMKQKFSKVKNNKLV